MRQKRDALVIVVSCDFLSGKHDLGEDVVLACLLNLVSSMFNSVIVRWIESASLCVVAD